MPRGSEKEKKYTSGRKELKMFKFLSTKDQLLEEKRKNEALQAQIKEQEDALIELAEIIAANEEAIVNG